MNERVIVLPLDGSALAEHAIPYGESLARVMDAALLLVTVWDNTEHELPADAPDGRAQLERYLEKLAATLEARGVRVETEVGLGPAADEIIRIVGERDAALLVIATHGRSGISRWRYGSVAARVVREASAPTLVLGPNVLAAKGERPVVRRILLPLDGSAMAETALRPAAHLANVLGAELVVARVLSWPGQAYAFGVPEVDMTRLDRELAAAANEYLEKARSRIETERPAVLRVVHGQPAEALTALEEEETIDLVVMTSHARAGLARAVLGSVADRMLQGKAPVLLIRPEGVTAVARRVRGRYCHVCGRASPFVNILAEDRCLRCGQHLHTCGNCVYFDNLACLLQRPEARATPPGLECPYFQFRETEAPVPARSEITT